MKQVKYLLIGGGLASFHAAKMLRRNDPDGSILIVSEEDLPPYDRPPLSKEILRGERTPEEVVYESAAKLAEQSIDLALGTRVERLDPAAKTVTLADGETVTYEKALIATGGRPIRLPVRGADLAGVHYLRDAADAIAISKDATPGSRAVIIGGGFIGIESAASLSQRGVTVTVIEALPHIWARFCDETLAGFFQGHCADQGISFLTSEMAAEIKGDDRVRSVVTKSGQTIECDFICIGIGIVPNVELAQEAGLAVDNGIVVDEHLRTSDPDIYAAGDVINYYDTVFAKRRRVEHWGHAEYAGQVAAQNMAGGDASYDFLSYVWSDIYDLRIEFAGDESERDQVLVRGRPGEGPFTVFYLKEGVLTAYFAINTQPRDFAAYRQLIRRKIDLRGREAELADPESNTRDLLR